MVARARTAAGLVGVLLGGVVGGRWATRLEAQRHFVECIGKRVGALTCELGRIFVCGVHRRLADQRGLLATAGTGVP